MSCKDHFVVWEGKCLNNRSGSNLMCYEILTTTNTEGQIGHLLPDDRTIALDQNTNLLCEGTGTILPRLASLLIGNPWG